MSDFATLHEIVKAAHRNLSPGAWDYLTGVAGRPAKRSKCISFFNFSAAGVLKK